MPGIRDASGKFVKGISGNPNGRTKVPDNVRDMLKAACPEAAQKLIDTMRNSKDDRVAVDCAKVILDRSYGKAPQSIDIGNKDDKAFDVKINVDKLTVEELDNLELLITRALEVEDVVETDNSN